MRATWSNTRAIVFVGIALLATGCMFSIESVLPPGATEFDSSALGEWVIDSGDESVTISRGEGDTLLVVYRQDSNVTRYQGALGRLGGRQILDLWPDIAPADTNYMMVQGHIFMFVDRIGAAVKLSELDTDSIDKALHSGRLHLHYLERGDQFIIDEPTARLRAEAVRFMRRPGVLNECGIMVRPPSPDTTWAICRQKPETISFSFDAKLPTAPHADPPSH